MTDLMLVTGLIALLAYGYWLMARLDRYVSHRDRPRAGFAGPWNALQSVLAASMKRLAPLLSAQHCAAGARLARGVEPRKPHTPFAV